MDADHAGPEERLGVEDAPVDVRLGGEVDDGVDVGDERPDDLGIGDVALDEPEPVAPAGSSSTSARFDRLPA